MEEDCESQVLLREPSCTSKYYGINVTDDCEENANDKVVQPTADLATTRSADAIISSKGQRVWTEAACSLIACLASLKIGVIVGFSSPTLTQLDRAEHFNQIIEAGTIFASVFGALVSVGAIVGGLIAWPLSDALGRKPCLMLGGVPAFAGWLMIGLSWLITESRGAFLGVLLTGRLLTGISVGWFFFCVSVYVSEIASARLKGLFGSCNQLFASFGVLVSYFYGVSWNGKMVKYWEFAIVGAVLVVVFEFLMLFTVETPRWLLSKLKEERAVTVLSTLRGPHSNTLIFNEVEKIKSALKENCNIRNQLVELLCHRAVFIPFLLVLMLMFFQQFSGIVPAIFYAAPILKDAGITLDVNLVSALAIGISQVIGTLLSVFLIDCIGRRILLTISGSSMVLSNFLLGMYFYIYREKCGSCLGSVVQCNITNNIFINHTQSHDTLPCNTTHFGALAIASIVFFTFTYSLGWGPIPWNAMSELMPNRVRTLAASIATSLYWSFCTIVSLSFHSYSNIVTPEGSWWTFTVIVVLAIVVVVIFLPETKGHSLEEIQEHFEKGHVFAVSCHKGRHRQPQDQAHDEACAMKLNSNVHVTK